MIRTNVVTEVASRADTLADYLGPAEVLEVGPVSVRVSVGRCATWARLALAVPYEPRAEDTVLVIARNGEAYVIGLLEGRGRLSLDVPGDVTLRAVGGVLTLHGDRGVSVSGPSVEILAAERLKVVAETATQLFGAMTRRIRGLFTSQDGERMSLVEGARVEQSKTATIVTEETLTLNGTKINLG